jgi:hypothetical protein
MNTDFPSAQAFKEMFERSVRLRDEAKAHLAASVYRDAMEMDAHNHEGGAWTSDRTHSLRDSYREACADHDALLASVVRIALGHADLTAEALDGAINASFMRILHVQVKMEKLNQSMEYSGGQVGPRRRRIYETNIGDMSEEVDRLARRHEALLAAVRRIAQKYP